MFATNDLVEVMPERGVSGESVGGYGTRYVARQGTIGRVTRAYRETSQVRFEEGQSTPFSIIVANYDLRPASGPAYRGLGVKPEGDEYLDPHDPRLAWFWDDVSRLANRSQYCDTFDSFLTQLKAPARKKEFTARGKLGGIELTAKIMARTQQDADKEFVDQLAAAVAEAARTEATA